MRQLSRVRRRLGMPAEDLAWLGAIAAAVLLAAVLVWVAPVLAKLYPAPDQSVFAAWRGLIRPEHTEDVRAAIALATPFLGAIVVLALSSRGVARRSLDPLIVAAQLVGIGLLTWAVLRQPHILALVPVDYLQPLLLARPAPPDRGRLRRRR